MRKRNILLVLNQKARNSAMNYATCGLSCFISKESEVQKQELWAQKISSPSGRLDYISLSIRHLVNDYHKLLSSRQS